MYSDITGTLLYVGLRHVYTKLWFEKQQSLKVY